MIDKDATLVHHFFQMTETLGMSRIPASARQHDFQRIVQPFEYLAQLAYHRQLWFRKHVAIVRHRLMRQNRLHRAPSGLGTCVGGSFASAVGAYDPQALAGCNVEIQLVKTVALL